MTANVGGVLCFLLALTAPTLAAETGGDKVTPLLDMVPVLSQIKSLVQLVSGDIEGSGKTAVNFLEDGIGTSQLRSAYYLLTGDVDKALETQKKFGRNVEVLVDSLPIVGHVKGAIHLMNGNEKRGWSAIKHATSSTFSLLGGVLAGPIGLVGGQVIGDGAITFVDSFVNGDVRPHGIFDYAATMYSDELARESLKSLQGKLKRLNWEHALPPASSSDVAPTVAALPSSPDTAPTIAAQPSSPDTAPTLAAQPSSPDTAPTLAAQPSSTDTAPTVAAQMSSTDTAPTVETQQWSDNEISDA